jgi:hypothetical protein
MTDANGIGTGKLQPSSQNSKALTAPLQPYSGELQAWIVLELARLAKNYPNSYLDEQNIAAYVETLCGATQSRLLKAFRSAPREFPQFFPTSGQLLGLADHDEDPEICEWQGPTDEERRQRVADIQSGEAATWWAEMKSGIVKLGVAKRQATPEVYRAPIREMSDEEHDARLEYLRQQAQIVEKRYGTQAGTMAPARRGSA